LWLNIPNTIYATVTIFPGQFYDPLTTPLDLSER